MSSDNSKNLTPSGVCSPTQPNSFPPHVPLVQRQFDCEDRGPRKPDKNKHIGHIYEWSNGERLDPNIDCHLTIGGETTIHKLANGKDLFCEAPPGEYKAELLPNFDEQKLTTARQELKEALDAIIKHEEAETAALQKIQDQQSAFSNALDLTGSAVSGFFLSGVGLIKDTKAWSDLINPFNHFANAAISAWNAKSSNGKSWVESFANNYSEAQKNDLVKALGFDPSKIKPEDLAQAFEIACFVYEDAPSQELLKNFSITYVKVQHRREWAKVAGAAVFEIVLAALLILFTGGVGLAARAAGSISTKLLGLLKKLGEVLKKLGAWLRSYRIKSNGTVRGISGNEAAPVIIPRPSPIVINDIRTPSSPLQQASESTTSNSTKPEWLRRIDAGNEFNKIQSANYPHNEVYINKPESKKYYRLDSYNPTSGEIISRKHTQFSDITEQTGKDYIREAANKYPAGSTIANVPSSGALAGQKLQGSLILEVPPQAKPVPQSILKLADDSGILIRDTKGVIY
ncbi:MULTISPECIES: hypothetical protein [Pseudomonas]|uniref:hypothetical protein n=1 Tax=Pseudomonas TaxID=286 RepID=UPI0015B0068F|nr:MULTISPECIES: hypothetical protein [Pseudomonas]